MVRSSWRLGAEEITQVFYLDLLLVLSRFFFRFYTAPCCPRGNVSCTAVVSSLAFSPLPKRTTTRVISDPSDSWPAVVFLPSSGQLALAAWSIKISPLHHVLPLGELTSYSVLAHYNVRVLPTTGDILECGDLGCVSGSHSSSA